MPFRRPRYRVFKPLWIKSRPRPVNEPEPPVVTHEDVPHVEVAVGEHQRPGVVERLVGYVRVRKSATTRIRAGRLVFGGPERGKL